jgi:anti-sigma factor RsiW
MKCLDLQNIETYLSGDLDSEAARQLELHCQICPACAANLEREEALEKLLRRHLSLEVPAGFHNRMMNKIALEKQSRTFFALNWGIGLGLIIAFLGFLVGKMGGALLPSLYDKFQQALQQSTFLQNLEIAAPDSISKWLLDFSQGNYVMIVNLAVGGIILSWGLWQMVKALNR